MTPARVKGLRVALVVVLLAGSVFALQGARVLPSALMYGRTEWIAIGLGMVVAALLALWRLRGR